MSDWITDRRPTEEDACYITSIGAIVWVTDGIDIEIATYDEVAIGTPWMPFVPPEPYVKPKRHQAKYNNFYGYWVVVETETLANVGKLYQLTENNDEHRRAAERIAAIYEEEMP